jgi:hypothetical protein
MSRVALAVLLHATLPHPPHPVSPSPPPPSLLLLQLVKRMGLDDGTIVPRGGIGPVQEPSQASAAFTASSAPRTTCVPSARSAQSAPNANTTANSYPTANCGPRATTANISASNTAANTSGNTSYPPSSAGPCTCLTLVETVMMLRKQLEAQQEKNKVCGCRHLCFHMGLTATVQHLVVVGPWATSEGIKMYHILSWRFGVGWAVKALSLKRCPLPGSTHSQAAVLPLPSPLPLVPTHSHTGDGVRACTAEEGDGNAPGAAMHPGTSRGQTGPSALASLSRHSCMHCRSGLR